MRWRSGFGGTGKNRRNGTHGTDGTDGRHVLSCEREGGAPGAAEGCRAGAPVPEARLMAPAIKPIKMSKNEGCSTVGVKHRKPKAI